MNAIGIVRQMVADGQVSKDVAEKYFPELKDSEDETIRKVLIQYFSTFRLGTFAGLEPKKIIAWLEKQGTPAKLSEEEQNRFAKGVLSSCALSFIDYLDAHKYEGKMCVSNGECEDIENAFHNAMWDRLHRYYCKYIEKQGEQRPVPKFEVGDVMRTLQEAADNITSGLPVVVSIDDEYYRCNNELIAIKDQDDYEYPPMNRTQKPTWSEEDEKQARQIERIVRDGGCTQKLQKQIADWLKSLKDRVGCEMNCTTTKEWSEEDRRNLNWVINVWNRLRRGGDAQTTPSQMEYLENFLKSLKGRVGCEVNCTTTWKPSDEMLEALDIEIRAGIQLGTWEETSLRELQKQLKKLREE